MRRSLLVLGSVAAASALGLIAWAYAPIAFPAWFIDHSPFLVQVLRAAGSRSDDMDGRFKARMERWPEDGSDTLIASLRHRESGVRASAARAIGHRHIDTAAQQLRLALRDPDPVVRFETVEALAAIGDKGAGPALIRCATEHPVLSARVAFALHRLGAPSEAHQLFRACLAASDEYSQLEGAKLMHAAGTAVPIELWDVAARHADARVRFHAAEALRGYEDARRLAILLILAADSNDSVRASAQGALSERQSDGSARDR